MFLSLISSQTKSKLQTSTQKLLLNYNKNVVVWILLLWIQQCAIDCCTFDGGTFAIQSAQIQHQYIYMGPRFNFWPHLCQIIVNFKTDLLCFGKSTTILCTLLSIFKTCISSTLGNTYDVGVVDFTTKIVPVYYLKNPCLSFTTKLNLSKAEK